MKQKTKSPIPLRIISVIFLMLWMGLIFFLSHQNADQSDNVSGGLIEAVIKIILPRISAENMAVIVSGLQFIVRKSAHFTLYFVLGFLSFLSVVTYERLKLPLRTVISLTVGLGYAASDEYHQTFISGRSGELRDVCIDFCGVLLAVLISLLIYKLKRRFGGGKVSKMRKKQYIELCETLQQELHKAKITADELREENFSLTKEVSALKEENNGLKVLLENAKAEETPVQEEDAEVTKTAEIPDDMKYGAEVIGKIVLNAAKHCNSLTSLPTTENAKELVNLILGRTEVAKSEILKIVALDIDRNSKVIAMEKEYAEAEDYFQSVMAQK